MKFLMIKLQAPGGILLRAMAGTYLPATGGTHLSATGGTPRASRAPDASARSLYGRSDVRLIPSFRSISLIGVPIQNSLMIALR